MLGKLLPRDLGFFDFFEQHAALTVAGAREFLALAQGQGTVEGRARRVKEIEHEADGVTHRCVEALHRTFITPFDRDDIHRIISRLDDVLDFVDDCADRLLLYRVEEMRPDLAEMATALAQAAEELERTIGGLRDLRKGQAILDRCVAIAGIEKQADAILRRALARLFSEEKDPIAVIKWKEIYEHLEDAIDRCEDVANTIEGVVLENG